MTDQTLLARASKARFDDLPSFSGHPSEDVERFLKCIKNITKANAESTNHETLEIVRGKLTQSAGIWFDNNEVNFKRWSDFETAFRNRYFSTTIIPKKFEQLKRRQQKPDEAIPNYYDDVVNLCREIDPDMSDSMIIQHLISGLNPDFRKELSRRESAMNSLDGFLKYAKIEQDLHDTFEKLRTASINTQQPYFDFNQPSNLPVTATINPRAQDYQNIKKNDQPIHSMRFQSSVLQRNSGVTPTRPSPSLPNTFNRNASRPNLFNRKSEYPQSTSQKYANCKICGRNNHRTIDCFHKQPTGCFKCGQNHMIRDCDMLQNFQ